MALSKHHAVTAPVSKDDQESLPDSIKDMIALLEPRQVEFLKLVEEECMGYVVGTY